MVRALYGNGSVYGLVAEQRIQCPQIFVPVTRLCGNGSSIIVFR